MSFNHDTMKTALIQWECLEFEWPINNWKYSIKTTTDTDNWLAQSVFTVLSFQRNLFSFAKFHEDTSEDWIQRQRKSWKQHQNYVWIDKTISPTWRIETSIRKKEIPEKEKLILKVNFGLFWKSRKHREKCWDFVLLSKHYPFRLVFELKLSYISEREMLVNDELVSILFDFMDLALVMQFALKMCKDSPNLIKCLSG